MVTFKQKISFEMVNPRDIAGERKRRGRRRRVSHLHLYAELQIVFRYHGPNDPWLCKMMGQFSIGGVNDNLKCTHLQY